MAKNLMKLSVLGLSGMALAQSLTGCASIVSKSDYPVALASNVPEAEVTIRDRHDKVVEKVQTPATVYLPAKAGYFKSAQYTFAFEKPGYEASEESLKAKLDPWYVGGNFLLGGLIGWVIVDPATGAMWKLDKEVQGNLVEKQTAQTE